MLRSSLTLGVLPRRSALFSLSAASSILLAGCGGGGGGGGDGPTADLNPPALSFASFQSDQRVVQSGSVQVAWIATDADDVATVSIFADLDGDVTTTADQVTLVDEVPEQDGARQQLTVDLGTVAEGSYAVLGRIRDGKGGESRETAPGRLIIENRALLAPLPAGTLEIVSHLPRADGSFDLLGRFRGLVDFDARNRLQSTSRTWDLFVSHHTARGVISWLRVFESTGDMEPGDFVRAPDGDLLVAGSYGGTLNLPGGGSTRGAGFDVFLSRLSADGEARWVRTATSLNSDIAQDIALLSDGSCVVTGTFNIGNTTYGIDFGNDRSGSPISLMSRGIAEGFVARYESDGTPMWARSFGGSAEDRGLAVTVLDGDRVLVGGSIEMQAGFGDMPTLYFASGGADGFVSEWAADGSIVDVELYSGTGAEQVVGLARCADGDLAVLANSNSAELDLASRTTVPLASGSDIVLARLAADGQLRWAFGEAVGDGANIGTDLLAMPNGDLLVAGSYADGARFAPDASSLPALGGIDGFVTRHRADGSLVWRHRLASSAIESGLAVSTGADGSILITGDRGNGDLEVMAQRTSLALPGSGSAADFLARLNPDGEFGRAANLDNRVAGTATLSVGAVTVRVDGLSAIWEGFDDAENTAAVRRLRDEHPLVGLLVVQRANGPDRGSNHLQAARLIAAAGLETHIPFNGTVYGGGIDLFLGGRRRTVGDGAVVGVRSWRDDSRVSGYDIRGDRGNPAHQLYLDFYADLGVPEDYYWLSIETPRSTFRTLTRAEMEQLLVVTD